MSLYPEVPGLDRYERDVERYEIEAEAAEERDRERRIRRFERGLQKLAAGEPLDEPRVISDEEYDRLMTKEQYLFDRDEDYLMERQFVEAHGEEW